MPLDCYKTKSCEFKEVENHVLKLWENNGYEERKKLLDWAYGECAIRCKMNSSFSVLTYNNSIVGCCGVVERKIKLGNEIYTSGYPNNFLVDKNHRSLGPALKLQKHVLSLKKYQHVYAVPNSKSDGVLRRAGYKQIGKMERWVLVLKTEKYLRKLFKRPFFVKYISVIADVLLSIKYIFKGINRKNITTDIIDNFDERFDAFWEEINGNYSILGERNSEYLEWRFTHYPLIDYKIFILQDSNNRLVAYLVFSASKTGYVIEDIFAENEKICINLLEQFLKFSKKESRDSISIRFFGDPAIFRALNDVGFKKRSDSNSVLIFSKKNNEDIYNKDNWFLTAADLDV